MKSVKSLSRIVLLIDATDKVRNTVKAEDYVPSYRNIMQGDYAACCLLLIGLATK